MSNPYESPNSDPYKSSYSPEYSAPVGHVPSPLVQQVRIIAILNAIQGGLEILMGLIQGSMAFVFPAIMMMDPNLQDDPEAPPDAFFWGLGIAYAIIGLALLIGGGLRILATFRNWNFRGRMLGIVSMGVGMVSMLTCYCAPTGIGLLVWGLIAYLNPSVIQAFEMGEDGEHPETILQTFSPHSHYQSPPPNKY